MQKFVPPILITILLLIAGLSNADAAARDAPPLLNVNLGKVGVLDDSPDPYRYGIELRLAPVGSWKIVPTLGIEMAENDAYFVYAEARKDFRLAERWLLTPGFGIGAFEDQGSNWLGHVIEFRSGLELAYEFTSRYRLGVGIFHVSNGGISSHNPGTESVVFSLSIPLGNRSVGN